MKKSILFGACMLSLLAGVSSCSNDEVADNNGATGKQISITAGISNGADSRVAYEDNGSKVTVSWSDSESFTMYQGTGSTGTEFSKSTSGNVFQGTLPTGSGTYYGVYGTDIINTDGVLTVDLSSQIGTNAENGIKEFMVAEATDLNQSMTFAHKLAVLKLTLTLPGNVEGTVSKVSISGMHNKADYKLGDTDPYTYIDDNKGEIVATGNNGEGFTISESKITAYIAVFPETVVANKIEITAQVGTDYYGYTLKSEKTLVAGQVTPVTVTLTEKKINFKETYTAADYYRWDAWKSYENISSGTWGENSAWYNTNNVAASATCRDCPTYDDLINYINAGVVYYDGGFGTVKNGLQTFTTPANYSSLGSTDTQENHSGIWLLKKVYWPETMGTEDYKETTAITADNAADIRTSGKYFFLPAAGRYYDGYFSVAGSIGYYWSSTPDDEGGTSACYLGIYADYVEVAYYPRGNGYLPMVAE